MFEYQETGAKTSSSHRISFSIIDILDPKKFTRKKADGVEKDESHSRDVASSTKSTGDTEALSVDKDGGKRAPITLTTIQLQIDYYYYYCYY